MGDCSRRAFGISERPDVKEYDQSKAMRGKIVMKPPCRDVPIVMTSHEKDSDGNFVKREVDHFEMEGERFVRVVKTPYQEKDLDWMGD